MTALSVSPAYPIFTDRSGQPLENGYIWIGAANQPPQTNPIAVFWDAALSQPAAQPVRTINGYPSNSGTPGRLYVSSDYSLMVQDAKGSVVYSAPASTERLGDIGSEDVLFVQAGAGAVTRSVQEKLRDVVSVWDFMSPAQISACQARSFAVDMAAAIQAAHNASDNVYYPPGGYRSNASITVDRAAKAMGAGLLATDVYFYGCDGYIIDVNNSAGITIEKMAIRSVTSGGAADPRAHTAITCPGTAVANVNFFVGEDLYLQGWNRGFDWRYTWNSNLSRVTTINCNTGLRLFGQSVNNSVNGGRIGANGGVACIDLVADGAVIGEGLNISDCLIASGQFGVRSNNGWLSLNLTNVIIDLITDVGLKMVDVRKLSITGGWVFATNIGLEYVALGTAEEVDSALAGVHIIPTAGTGRGVVWEGGNKGLTITGGSIACGASGRCVDASGDGVSVTGVRLINPGSNASLLFSGEDCSEAGNTGNTSVQFTAGRPGVSRGRQITYRTGLVYSASITPDASRGNLFNVVVTNSSPFTINAPTNPPTDPETQDLTVTIANASGGALGSVTWNAIYKLAAWTQPANGFGRSITFRWNGSNWLEVSRTPADVPN